MQMLKKKKNKNIIIQKLSYTVYLIALSRLGTFIPVPGINHEALYQAVSNNSVVSFLNLFSGGGFALLGLFALNIFPFINASILIQIAISLFPSLEKLQKEEGEVGRQKIIQFTRYTALGWSILQSLGLALWVKPYVFDWNAKFALETTVALTTGSMIIMWIAEKITEKGIGNGTSILISVNILSGLPKLLQQNQSYNAGVGNNLVGTMISTMIFLGIIAGIIFIQEGSRNVPILSARQLRQGQIETKINYLPLRLNQGGVMPLVFASVFLVLPEYINQITGNSTIIFVANLLTPSKSNSFVYLLFYFSLILFFNYFYSSLTMNPVDVAKNLRKMECTIPRVKPGKATSDYLQKILHRLTFLGALFLAALAVIPPMVETWTNVLIFKGLGATSLIILVGVAIDISRQIQTYGIMKSYEDILS